METIICYSLGKAQVSHLGFCACAPPFVGEDWWSLITLNPDTGFKIRSCPSECWFRAARSKKCSHKRYEGQNAGVLILTDELSVAEQ